jgi:hypothetical protein
MHPLPSRRALLSEITWIDSDKNLDRSFQETWGRQLIQIHGAIPPNGSKRHVNDFSAPSGFLDDELDHFSAADADRFPVGSDHDLPAIETSFYRRLKVRVRGAGICRCGIGKQRDSYRLCEGGNRAALFLI